MQLAAMHVAQVQECRRRAGGAPPALRHPRKVSRSSAQARRKANALERALRMLCEKRPDLEISIPGRRRPPSSQVQVCSAMQGAVQCSAHSADEQDGHAALAHLRCRHRGGIAVAANAAVYSRSMVACPPPAAGAGSTPAHHSWSGATAACVPTSERLRSSSMMALVGLISSVFLLLMYAAMLLSRRACGRGGGAGRGGVDHEHQACRRLGGVRIRG